jgi:hypothetical protein
MVNRPRDVSFTITEWLAKSTGQGDVLGGTIDRQQVALGGHSLGGYATYALTGGDRLVCDALAPVIAGLETLPYPPNTCVRIFPDRRIKTMISLDGSSWLMRYSELAKIVVPSLIMGETVDQSQAIDDASGLPETRSWIALLTLQSTVAIPIAWMSTVPTIIRSLTTATVATSSSTSD